MRPFKLLIFFLLTDSCINRVEFEPSGFISQLVVDGMITDEPGPYTIKLSKTQPPYDATQIKKFSAKSVQLFDDAGHSELLTEVKLGEYQTSANGMRGTVGGEYFIRIETFDGKTYESVPERMNPAGFIENIYYVFDQFKPENGSTGYRFKFFIDAKGNSEGDNLFRWKLNATYRVETNPELHGPPPPLSDGGAEVACDNKIPFGDPRRCGGYVIDAISGLIYVGPPCTCCTCWVTLQESKPNISSKQIYTNGAFKDVYVGQVPVEYWTFYDKVYIEVSQQSLTKKASAYWKTIQDQKESANSLFQPAIGKATSNVYLKNGEEEVQGYFFASALARRTLPQKFIKPSDIPLGPSVIVKPCPLLRKESCLLAFKNSTNQKPSFWE